MIILIVIEFKEIFKWRIKFTCNNSEIKEGLLNEFNQI